MFILNVCFLLQEISNTVDDIGDTSCVRKSICGLNLMEESSKGVYVGPKDGVEQTDVFVTMDETHLKIHFYELGRSIELSKNTCAFIKEKSTSILDAIKSSECVSFNIKIDASSIVKVTNSEVPREMIDIRVWYRNCVGRWAPTRRGVRLHYIHFRNTLSLIEKML